MCVFMFLLPQHFYKPPIVYAHYRPTSSPSDLVNTTMKKYPSTEPLYCTWEQWRVYDFFIKREDINWINDRFYFYKVILTVNWIRNFEGVTLERVYILHSSMWSSIIDYIITVLHANTIKCSTITNYVVRTVRVTLIIPRIRFRFVWEVGRAEVARATDARKRHIISSTPRVILSMILTLIKAARFPRVFRSHYSNIMHINNTICVFQTVICFKI